MEVDAVHSPYLSEVLLYELPWSCPPTPISLNAFNKTELRPTPAKTAVRPRGYVQWMEGLAVELIKR
jgi:hypothetical protein